VTVAGDIVDSDLIDQFGLLQINRNSKRRARTIPCRNSPARSRCDETGSKVDLAWRKTVR